MAILVKSISYSVTGGSSKYNNCMDNTGLYSNYGEIEKERERERESK